LKPYEFKSLTWGEFNDLANVRLNYLDLEEEKRHMAKGEILAAICNTVPRKAGKEGYTYKDFMPQNYLDKHPKEDILPSSSPEQARDWVERHNKNFPNDLIKFDYNKNKN